MMKYDCHFSLILPLPQLFPVIVHFHSTSVLYSAHYIVYCRLLNAWWLRRCCLLLILIPSDGILISSPVLGPADNHFSAFALFIRAVMREMERLNLINEWLRVEQTCRESGQKLFSAFKFVVLAFFFNHERHVGQKENWGNEDGRIGVKSFLVSAPLENNFTFNTSASILELAVQLNRVWDDVSQIMCLFCVASSFRCQFSSSNRTLFILYRNHVLLHQCQMRSP